MKYILHTFVFCSICIISEVQAQIQITKDSLSVTKLVAFEEKVNFENYQVKFKKVIADSRCPKNATCIRAGEA